MRKLLTIGEAARLVGVTPKTVRHYHGIGLLAEPERSEAGYRLYGASCCGSRASGVCSPWGSRSSR